MEEVERGRKWDQDKHVHQVGKKGNNICLKHEVLNSKITESK